MPASALTLESRVTRLEYDSSQILSLLLETRHDMANGLTRLEFKMDSGFANASVRADELEIKIDSGFANASVLLRKLETTMNQNFALQHSDMLALTNRQNVHESLTEMNFERLFGLFECSKAEQED